MYSSDQDTLLSWSVESGPVFCSNAKTLAYIITFSDFFTFDVPYKILGVNATAWHMALLPEKWQKRGEKTRICGRRNIP